MLTLFPLPSTNQHLLHCFLTAEEMGYDMEVLQEAYEWQIEGDSQVKLSLCYISVSLIIPHCRM
jgi:hypothetical protein